jgi:alkylation response protein AidB-like acyl-CoA dehydrogenase
MLSASTNGLVPHFGLSPELRDMRDEVRAWAVETLRPRAAALEWQPDPADRVAWDLVEEASERGWRTLGLSTADGGGGADALGLAVLVEELAYGDMGFAVLIDQCLKVQRILAELARGSARELFLERFMGDPRCVLGICFTEPETSSDYIIDGPNFRFRTTAERRSDGSWVLNGYKHYISPPRSGPAPSSCSPTTRASRSSRCTRRCRSAATTTARCDSTTSSFPRTACSARSTAATPGRG